MRPRSRFFNENRERSDGIGFREHRFKFEERDLTVNQIMGAYYFQSLKRASPDFALLNWLEKKLPEETKITWKYSDSRAATAIPNEVTVAGVTTSDPMTGEVITSAVDPTPGRRCLGSQILRIGLRMARVPVNLRFRARLRREISGSYEWSTKASNAQQQFSVGSLVSRAICFTGAFRRGFFGHKHT